MAEPTHLPWDRQEGRRWVQHTGGRFGERAQLLGDAFLCDLEHWGAQCFVVYKNANIIQKPLKRGWGGEVGGVV